MERVSLLRCGSYEPAVLDDVIERHFCLLEEGAPLIREGARVLIKPNLLLKRRPEEATTTHPAFVAAIIRAVKRRGGIPAIAESPGGPYTKGSLHGVYSSTGMEEVARREGALLNYELGSRAVPAKGYKVCSSFEIINPVVEADLVISAAKLKTHGMMNYSGAVKNLFGVVPGLMKPEFHFRYPDKKAFANMLVDLCETVAPAVSFIDGIIGMEGDGPSGGEAKFAGITAASRNPHALDLLCSRLIGMSPREVYTVLAAAERGLCPDSLEGLEIVGDRAESLLTAFKMPQSRAADFTENYHLPRFVRRPLEKLLTPRPEIVAAACVGCGKCAESCPRHTITVEGGKASIGYDQCIRCFCCHEMCPARAIRIKKFRLFSR